MRSIVNFISLDDIVSEYRMFEAYLHKHHDIPSKMSTRVLREVIESHISAILDERIFALFRKFSDRWELQLIDMITSSSLTEGEVVKIANSKQYHRLSAFIASEVNRVANQHDPNFTIWSVIIPDALTTVSISADGDYRIEQWHHEHSVTKLNVTDTLTLDITHIRGQIKKLLKYNHAPAYINRRVTSGELIPKSEFFDNAINMFINHVLKDTPQSAEVFAKILEHVKRLHLINDDVALGREISSYLEYELIHQVDKLTKGRNVSSYFINGDELVVNLGSSKSNTDETRSFSELEIAIAEANGDYIPERMRK